MTDFISSVQVLPSFTDVIAASGLNSNLPICGMKQILVFMIKLWVTINYD